MAKRAFPVPTPAALPTKARRRSGALSELAAAWKAPKPALAAPSAPAARAARVALSSKRVSATETAPKRNATVKDETKDIVESGDEEEEDMEWDGVIPDDHDRDSVDSDTSGTISEDLDLNKANDSDDDEDNSDSSDDDDEDGDEKTITVDFDFKDPAPIDFLSVRNLLTRYLPAAETPHDADDTPAAIAALADDTKEVVAASDSSADSGGSEDDTDEGGKTTSTAAGSAKRAKKSQADIISAFNPSDLADAYVNQVEVGTCVKAGDDPDVYAFVTALGFDEHKALPALRVVSEFLLKKCPKRKKPQLRAVMNNKRTALLLNERMVNMPAEIAPNLHRCFVDDLDWASKQSDLGARLDFRQFVVMIPKFQSKSTVKKVAPEARAAVLADSKRLPKPAPGSASEEDSSSAEDGDEADTEIAVTKASAGAAAPTVNDRTLHCYKWEEALLEEMSTLQYTFGVGAASQIEGSVPQFRTVIVISASKYQAAVNKMQDKLAEAMKAEAEAQAAATTTEK